MPLAPGNSQSVISSNISELTHHGSRPRSHAQIVAIALSNADRHPHAATGGGIGSLGKRGGIGSITPSHVGPAAHLMSPSEGSPWYTRVAAREMTAPSHGIGHFAAGGMMSQSQASPWTERADARIMDQQFHGGLIGGSGAGRTDQLPLSVGSDSHVLSADVVSGLGQGHTAAGARILDASLGPYGVPLPKAFHGKGPPAPPHPFVDTMQPGLTGMERIATGGDHGGKTSILAASGEYVVPAENVEALGQRGMERGLGHKNESAMDLGHRLLDELVARVRRFNIEWLRHAPPPKK